MIESQQRALLYKNCMYCTRQYFLVYYRLVDSVVTISLTARGFIADKQLRYCRDIVTISATEHLGPLAEAISNPHRKSSVSLG